MSKLIAKHPTASYKITVVTGSSWFWCLMFGPCYYWAKGLTALGFVSLFTLNGAYIFMPMFNRRIIRSYYEQRGWKVTFKC